MISIKSANEIKKMRAAGRLVGECHNMLRDRIKPGVTTMQLNDTVSYTHLTLPTNSRV